MFWGLANCPPETVERVLGNYNKIMEKKLPTASGDAAIWLIKTVKDVIKFYKNVSSLD